MTRVPRLLPWISAVALVAGAATSSAQPASADVSISVLATNAITVPLTTIAQEHRRQTGQTVRLDFATSPAISRRLAEDATAGVEILIAATATIDQAIAGGQANADTRISVGRVGIGVVIPREAPRPDISSVDALSAALLAADAVVYSQGASGVYVAQMLETLGLAAALGSRAVQLPTGADMLERIAATRASEIGLTQISEIVAAATGPAGALAYIGPLPAPVQHYTTFDAVALTTAPQAARGFLRSLIARRARALLAANHWEL